MKERSVRTGPTLIALGAIVYGVIVVVAVVVLPLVRLREWWQWRRFERKYPGGLQ